MVETAASVNGGLEPRPLPTTVDEAWVNFSDVMMLVSDIPKVNFLYPLDQDLQEELGLTSLQMNDGRETLGNLHGIEIPPEPDRSKWPKTVADMFRKYVRYTPALAHLEANPNHELFSRTGQEQTPQEILQEARRPALGSTGLELATS